MARSDALSPDPRAAARTQESRRWRYLGDEPTAHELLAGQIGRLLMRADKLTPREVVAVLRAARSVTAGRVEA
jgi:hypothetical protein